MSEPDPYELVSTPVAAKVVGVSAKTLQRYVRKKIVKPARRLPGGHYRWRIADLEQQMDAITRAADDDDDEDRDDDDR